MGWGKVAQADNMLNYVDELKYLDLSKPSKH